MMKKTYDVYIKTDDTRGNSMHWIIKARSHDEAMDQVLSFSGFNYQTVETINVVPRKEN